MCNLTPVGFSRSCPSLGDVSVPRALAASSAVPIAFNPVTLKNYDSCHPEDPAWVKYARENSLTDERLRTHVAGFDSYKDKERRPYVHLADGGITDNLGVRSLYDRVEATGGAMRAFKDSNSSIPEYIIVIVVNAQPT